MNRIWIRPLRLLGLLALAVLVSKGEPAVAAQTGLFETAEFSGVPLPPWRGFVKGLAEASAAFDGCASATGCKSAPIRSVLGDIDTLASLPRRTQAERIHSLVNARPYRSDFEAYGQSDHWATPLEFLAHAGDCEDFAIFKYFLLRRLGFEPSSLRIVLGRDGESGGSHAILVVVVDGTALVLDNARDAVIEAAAVRFEPIYSFNERERIGHFAARPAHVAAIAPAPHRPAERALSATAGFSAAR